MRKVWHVYFFIYLTLATIGSIAATPAPATFQYKVGKSSYWNKNEIYAAWDSTETANILRPGLKILFWGRAAGCDLQLVAGPVTNQQNPHFQQAIDLTGIPLASNGNGQRWTPSADTNQCEPSMHGETADSFVHINEDPSLGGVGLFTFTGPNDAGRTSFFRQYSHSGKNNSGTNADIAGTFVSFRLAWQGESAVRPWGSGSIDPKLRNIEIHVVQSVASVHVQGGTASDSSQSIQAKQQTVVAFINRACARRAATNIGVCQVQYLFNTAIYRDRLTDWNGAAWFKNGGIMMDAGQNGMPVIHGPIPDRGQSINEPRSGLPLYTSFGEPSQHGTFKNKDFNVHISFSQLQNAIRLIVAKRLRLSSALAGDAKIVEVMGNGWNDPTEWALLSATVAQEVHNPDEHVRAYIGGSYKEFEIGPITE